MGSGGVVVRLTHSSPSAHECDGVDGGRCGTPRLGAIRVVELHIFTAVAAARGAFSYRVLPRAARDNCRTEMHQTLIVDGSCNGYLWDCISLGRRSSVAAI